MLTMNDLDPLLRRRSAVHSGDGETVGSVGVVYLDDADERPTWVTVHTGLFGTRESFVPLEGASVQGRRLVVAYPRELIKRAPSVDRDGHLSPEEEAELYQYYGLDRVAPTATASTAPHPETAASPPVGPAADDDDGTRDGRSGADTHGRMAARTHDEGGVLPHRQGAARTHDEGGTPWVVRSEEQLRVGTERVEAARVRLRKYVVTEDATLTVPLRREELRIEVEPISSPSDIDGDDLPFQEQSVELVAREEVAVVGKETVALERVRMQTVEVGGRATVRAEVRKERIASSVDGGVEGEARTDGRSAARGRASSARGRASTTEGRAPRTTGRTRADTGSPSTNGTKGNPLMKGGKRRR